MARVVGRKRLANNDFLLSSQFSVTGNLCTCLPDLVGFVKDLQPTEDQDPKSHRLFSNPGFATATSPCCQRANRVTLSP